MHNIEKNDVFDLAYRFVTETSENIFLTGKAGTGKTTFLKYLKENWSEKEREDFYFDNIGQPE